MGALIGLRASWRRRSDGCGGDGAMSMGGREVGVHFGGFEMGEEVMYEPLLVPGQPTVSIYTRS